MMGASGEDNFLSLAGRLARLDRQITTREREEFLRLSAEKTINTVVNELLNAHQPDKIEEKARLEFRIPEDKSPAKYQLRQAQYALIRQAASTFTGKLKKYIDNAQKVHEQIIDTVNID